MRPTYISIAKGLAGKIYLVWKAEKPEEEVCQTSNGEYSFKKLIVLTDNQVINSWDYRAASASVSVSIFSSDKSNCH